MNIRIKGSQVLTGEITPSGSKNSMVALIPATLLFDKPITLTNVPNITDSERLVDILKKLGSKIKWNKKLDTLHIDNSKIALENLTKEDLGNMKGTSLLWGPLLARFKKVIFDDLPGGCTLGLRPLTTHYDAFSKLGVKISESARGVNMDASKAKATGFWLLEMSPTATENIIMFACTLSGKTRIMGAASEPHVQDLCNFLNKCGAKIRGIGSSILEIEGVNSLKASNHTIISDHYEVATFLALGAITKGEITVHNAIPEHFPIMNNTFSQFGVDITYNGSSAFVDGAKRVTNPLAEKNRVISIKAQPWPGLPVDALPLYIPLGVDASEGNYLFHNWMYESGLFWTSELLKLGASLTICDPHRVIIHSGSKLKGATLEAPYIIRAVVAMVMACMIAEGESVILNADALYRGHPNFAKNLKKLGAIIEEI